MLKWRVLTAAVLIPPLVAALFWFPPHALALLIGLFVALGAWEWGRLCGLHGTGQAMYVAGVLFVGSALVVATLASERAGMGVLWAAAAWWLWTTVELARSGRQGLFERRSVRLVAGLLVLLPAWVGTVYLHATDPRTPLALLYVLVLVWLADSAAYLFGSMFGRTHLAPSISPGKTVEGVVGAVAGVVLLAWICGTIVWEFQAAAMALWICLAVVVALVSVVGDLTESKMKRIAGVKDSGTLLPGHGGVLDRIDALTSAVPVFALGWRTLFSITA